MERKKAEGIGPIGPIGPIRPTCTLSLSKSETTLCQILQPALNDSVLAIAPLCTRMMHQKIDH